MLIVTNKLSKQKEEKIMKNIERAALMAAAGVLAVGMTGCGKEPVKDEPKEVIWTWKHQGLTRSPIK